MEKFPDFYKIVLFDKDGRIQDDFTWAGSAQEAADNVRRVWEGCKIIDIVMKVYDWK